MSDAPVQCFGGKNDQGWTIDVFLEPGRAVGFIHFALDGERQFVHQIGLEEIALFASGRMDLIAPYLDGLLKRHIN